MGIYQKILAGKVGMLIPKDIGDILDMAPSQDASGKWSFRLGSPILEIEESW